MKKDKPETPKKNTSTAKDENLISQTSLESEKDEVKKGEEKLIQAKKQKK